MWRDPQVLRSLPKLLAGWIVTYFGKTRLYSIWTQAGPQGSVGMPVLAPARVTVPGRQAVGSVGWVWVGG